MPVWADFAFAVVSSLQDRGADRSLPHENEGVAHLGRPGKRWRRLRPSVGRASHGLPTIIEPSKFLRLGDRAGGAFGGFRRFGGDGEDLPYAINPVEVLGLHQDGAKAGQSFAVALNTGLQRTEETDGQLSDSEMQAALGGGREDGPRPS